MSRHSLALEHFTRGGTCTVGTLMAMEFGTVSHGTSVLAVSLDRALESLTFGDRGHINSVTVRKDIRLDLASKCIFFCVLQLQFSYIDRKSVV